jgi:hypothetical protein
MAGQLANAARRLELARGLGRKEAASIATLAWVAPVERVDRAALREGERVVEDVVILKFRGVDPSECEGRERVTSDADDVGVVRAYDGRAIGVVREVPRRGRVLEFAWPADLAPFAPEAAAG